MMSGRSSSGRPLNDQRPFNEEVQAIEALYFDYLDSVRRFENEVGVWTRDFDNILAEDDLHGNKNNNGSIPAASSTRVQPPQHQDSAIYPAGSRDQVESSRQPAAASETLPQVLRRAGSRTFGGSGNLSSSPLRGTQYNGTLSTPSRAPRQQQYQQQQRSMVIGDSEAANAQDRTTAWQPLTSSSATAEVPPINGSSSSQGVHYQQTHGRQQEEAPAPSRREEEGGHVAGTSRGGGSVTTHGISQETATYERLMQKRLELQQHQRNLQGGGGGRGGRASSPSSAMGALSMFKTNYPLKTVGPKGEILVEDQERATNRGGQTGNTYSAQSTEASPQASRPPMNHPLLGQVTFPSHQLEGNGGSSSSAGAPQSAAPRQPSVEIEVQTDPVQFTTSSHSGNTTNSAARIHDDNKKVLDAQRSVSSSHHQTVATVSHSTEDDSSSRSSSSPSYARGEEPAPQSPAKSAVPSSPPANSTATTTAPPPAATTPPQSHLARVTRWYLDNDPDNVHKAAEKLMEYKGRESQLIGDLERWKKEVAKSDKAHEEITKESQEQKEKVALVSPAPNDSPLAGAVISTPRNGGDLNPQSDSTSTKEEKKVVDVNPRDSTSDSQNSTSGVAPLSTNGSRSEDPAKDAAAPTTSTPTMVTEKKKQIGVMKKVKPEGYLERVTALYEKYDPGKVHLAPVQLKKHFGKEELVIKALVKKYGPEPEFIEKEVEEGGEGEGSGQAPGGMKETSTVGLTATEKASSSSKKEQDKEKNSIIGGGLAELPVKIENGQPSQPSNPTTATTASASPTAASPTKPPPPKSAPPPPAKSAPPPPVKSAPPPPAKTAPPPQATKAAPPPPMAKAPPPALGGAAGSTSTSPVSVSPQTQTPTTPNSSTGAAATSAASSPPNKATTAAANLSSSSMGSPPPAEEDPFWQRAAQAALADGTWNRVKDPKGRIYYVNRKEKKSCWNLPKELRQRAHNEVAADKQKN